MSVLLSSDFRPHHILTSICLHLPFLSNNGSVSTNLTTTTKSCTSEISFTTLWTTQNLYPYLLAEQADRVSRTTTLWMILFGVSRLSAYERGRGSERLTKMGGGGGRADVVSMRKESTYGLFISCPCGRIACKRVSRQVILQAKAKCVMLRVCQKDMPR